MLRVAYKQAYADVIPSPQLLLATERKARDMKNGRRMPRLTLRTALIAALLLALLAAIATATVRSDLLERLFGEKQPPEVIAEKLVTDVSEETVGGVTLTVDEYLNESGGVYLSWTVRSERTENVYYTLQEKIVLAGTDTRVEYDGTDSTTGDVNGLAWLSPDRPEYKGSIDRSLNSQSMDPNAEYELMLTLYAFESDFTPRYGIDWNRVGEIGEEAAIAELEKAKILEFNGEEDAVSWTIDQYPAVQAAYESEYQKAKDAGEPLYTDDLYAPKLVSSGIFRQVSSFTTRLPFTVSGPHAEPVRKNTVFAIPEGTFTLLDMQATRSGVTVRYTVKLKTKPDEIGIFDDPTRYVLRLPDGSLLESGGGSGNYTDTELEDGWYLYEHSCSFIYSGEIPEWVTFIPSQDDVHFEEGETSAEYGARVEESAGAENCFRVELVQK